MPVSVMRFERRGQVRWGVVRGDTVNTIPGDYASTEQFIRAARIEILSKIDGEPVPRSEVKILSPITRNQQFICLGANYRQHMIESGINPDDKHYNMLFTKAPGSIVPADHEVVRPRCVRFLDYEIELGLVLKKDITEKLSVSDENVADYVAGLVIVNDYSARDIQIPQIQFYKGKSFRTFAPVGPILCLLGPGDMKYLRSLQLTLTVNGEVRQRDTTANLVNSPAETLTELSGVHDLAPGDLIATGTPPGCALAVPSPLKQRLFAILPETMKWRLFLKVQEARPQYLKPGDVVESQIRSSDGVVDLGTQKNVIVEEA
jgi:2-keto-4-pentenoate hydratase/2-oxohepta-3-ene-1,7-dioic acid hydratase in catechol pathway